MSGRDVDLAVGAPVGPTNTEPVARGALNAF